MKNKEQILLMEVCGTHTMSIARFGIRSLIEPDIKIISGPGCPVCVTSASDIYNAIQLAKLDKVIIASFGDMLKVPCNDDNLMNYKNVRIIYNTLDAVKLAIDNKDKEIVLLGVGFETTTPVIAAAIAKAHKLNISNFSVLCMNKLVPQALDLIIRSDTNKVDGFLLPGHVAAVTGKCYFDFISQLGSCGVISGFDANNILSSIKILVELCRSGSKEVINNYMAVVSDKGNIKAQSLVKEIFEVYDAEWRGIGKIKGSGLKISADYSKYDAKKKLGLKDVSIQDPSGCICGLVLMGVRPPKECPLYAIKCTPSNPVGPCMVSSEGTCAAYYKYIGA